MGDGLPSSSPISHLCRLPIVLPNIFQSRKGKEAPFLLFWGPSPLHSNSGSRKQATPVSSRGGPGLRMSTAVGKGQRQATPGGDQSPLGSSAQRKRAMAGKQGQGSQHSRPYPVTHSPPTCRLSEQQGKLIIRLLRMR